MQAQAGDVEVGDRVQMRKPHPCGVKGSDEWTVIRAGADVKIKCARCGTIVMMDRVVFLRRRKRLLGRSDAVELISATLKELLEIKE